MFFKSGTIVNALALIAASVYTPFAVAQNVAIIERALPKPYSFARGITAGPDGALWFTEHGDNEIGRITTAGAITDSPLPTFSDLTAITAGPDGALWFTEASANKIGRITTGGVVTEYPVPTPSGYPVGIAAGPDAALWFTEADGNKIGRITTAGAITEYPVPTPNSYPAGIAAGSDGALWSRFNLPRRRRQERQRWQLRPLAAELRRCSMFRLRSTRSQTSYLPFPAPV